MLSNEIKTFHDIHNSMKLFKFDMNIHPTSAYDDMKDEDVNNEYF